MRERPRAALLAVGDELVLGEKLDTNSQWLADRLGLIGLRVTEHRTAPDDEEAIASSIVHLARSNDAVLVGGGLGPTADDLTRQSLACALEALTGKPQPLIEDAAAMEAIQAYYQKTGRTMPDTNRVQALRPEGTQGLPNGNGTAPGMLARVEIEGRERVIACLPGPPREMRPMFEDLIEPHLRAMPGVAAATLRVAQVYGLGESELAARIAELMQRHNNPIVGTTASSGMVTCRIRVEPSQAVRGPYASTLPLDAVEEALAAIDRAAEHYVVSREQQTLAATLLAEATSLGKTLATAESCTGGLVGQMLTAEPGSSSAYLGGWVTYGNAMKVEQLGVPSGTLEEHGAVSRQVAIAMAEGAARRANADVALSVTGIAGPDGGTSEKPVGLVWIGCAGPAFSSGARQFRFAGDRKSIRLWTAHTAFFIGLQALRGQAGARLIREVV